MLYNHFVITTTGQGHISRREAKTHTILVIYMLPSGFPYTLESLHGILDLNLGVR